MFFVAFKDHPNVKPMFCQLQCINKAYLLISSDFEVSK